MNWLYRQYGLRWPRRIIPVAMLLDGLYVICMLLILLVIYDWVGKRDELDRQTTKLEHAERIATHCMNGGAFRNERDALKCGIALYEKAN